MKLFLIPALLLIISASNAQITLQGIVKDSIGNPLELANVIAINKATETLESYGITNHEGRYKLDLKPDIDYNIQVSYIGFKTYEEHFKSSEAKINKDFILNSEESLNAVELVYEMPVTVKGDTIVYNADSFKTGTERKLEDILKNLPGIEINDNGKIEVEGKEVSKVMVEGKDFFDGDSKLATKNIPSDAVDKVQVLKNFSEVSQLSGVTNNQDNIAINIKLKEGKENFWFGDITAGSGFSTNNDGLYLMQPKLFYYSPKYSINIIGDINNTGDLAFTFKDYINFSGGFTNLASGSGTTVNLGDFSTRFLTLNNDKANEIDSQFAALNFSCAPKKTLDLSGFAIYSGTTSYLKENSFVAYSNDDFNIPDETTQSNTEQKTNLGLFKVSANYKPNQKNQLDYDLYAKISKQNEVQKFRSSVLGEIDQVNAQAAFNINQNLNYYYSLNDTHIFAFQAQHLWQDEDPFYNAILLNQINYRNTASGLGFDTNQSRYNLTQNKRVTTNKIDSKIDYWYVLNAKSNINITLGALNSYQKFKSNIFQILDSGSVFNPTPMEGANTNDVNYAFNDFYLGLHYNLKAGDFTLTPGFSLHHYNIKNQQFLSTYADSFMRILPDLKVRFEIKKNESLNLNYNMRTDFTDINKLAEAYVLNNYNSIFSGNRTLENALSHNLNLSYFSFNMFNYTSVFGSINYNKRIDAIRNQANFNSIVQSSLPFNSNFADDSFSFNGSFERRFGKFSARIAGDFSWSTFNQFINATRLKNKSFSQSYTTRLKSHFKAAPNIEAGYKLTVNESNQGGRKITYTTHAPYINVDAYILKLFTFKTEYTYNDFRNASGSLNSFSFLDLSLGYQKKGSHWEYNVGVTNILDTKSLNQSSESSFSVSANEYFIQPRYTLFSIKYTI